MYNWVLSKTTGIEQMLGMMTIWIWNPFFKSWLHISWDRSPVDYWTDCYELSTLPIKMHLDFRATERFTNYSLYFNGCQLQLHNNIYEGIEQVLLWLVDEVWNLGSRLVRVYLVAHSGVNTTISHLTSRQHYSCHHFPTLIHQALCGSMLLHFMIARVAASWFCTVLVYKRITHVQLPLLFLKLKYLASVRCCVATDTWPCTEPDLAQQS